MANGTNELLEVSMRVEAVMGDTSAAAGVFTDGVLLRPLEQLPLDQFVKEAIGDTTVKRSFADPGLAAIEGLSTAVIPISLRMTGNTRSVGVLTEDGMSKVLNWAAGTRRAPGDDACEALSTISKIKATGHSYQVNDVVMINGEAALVVAKGADDFDIAPPLSAAPDALDVITGMESFWIDTASAPQTVGLGVTRTGDDEFEWAGYAGLVTKLEFGELTPGAQPAVNLEVMLADHAKQAITHSTTEIPTEGQVIGVVGARALRMTDSTGAALLAPDLASAQVGMGFEATFPAGLNANSVGGKVAPHYNPQDGEVGTIRVLQDPAADTFEDLNALKGKYFALGLQINNELGKTFGIIYPSVTYTKYPTPAAQGKSKAVEFGFKSGVGVIFRG